MEMGHISIDKAKARKIERPSFFFVRLAVPPVNFIFGSIFLPGGEKLGLFPAPIGEYKRRVGKSQIIATAASRPGLPGMTQFQRNRRKVYC
jgi:hypothetical protein